MSSPPITFSSVIAPSCGSEPLCAGSRAPSIGFALFIGTNIALMARPTELISALAGVPLYELLILGCLLTCLPQVIAQLNPGALSRQPATLCVIGLLVAVVLSHLSHGFVFGARQSGMEFLKVVLYYLLLVATIDSPRRLRLALLWIAALVTALAVLGLLQFYGRIHLEALTVLQDSFADAQTGESILVPRLRSAGIFNDPNDFCLILSFAMIICLYAAFTSGPLAVGWLGAMGMCGYALLLTRSRGGFLSLLAGMGALCQARFGWVKTIALGALGAPLLFVLFAGRSTEIDIGDGTGQARIQHWSQGLGLLRSAPLFGIGQGMFPDAVGIDAHNSFVAAYTDLGFVGGTLFFAAFALPGRALFTLKRRESDLTDPSLRSLRPYVLATLAAWAAGIFSLSRAYMVPTYMVVGLSAAHLNLVAREIGGAPSTTPALAVRVVAASAAFFGGLYVFIRLFVHWG